MAGALRRILVPVRDALLDGRRTVLLVVGVSGTGFGLLAPIDHLSHSGAGAPGLALPAIPEPGSVVSWTRSARSPAATQARAVDDLLTVLLVLAWTALAIAAVTVLTRYIARATRRAAEIGVRRAVGASRRDVFLALLAEAGVTGATALILGAILALVANQAAVAFWPGTIASGLPWSARAALAVLGAVGVGGFLAMGFVREEDLRHPDEGQVNLQVPTVQLGFSLAIVLSSSVLLQRGTVLSPEPSRSRAGVMIQLDSGITEPAIRAERYGVLLAALQRASDDSNVSLAGPGDALGLGMLDIVTTDCGQCYRGGIFIRYLHVNAVHRFVSPDSFEAGGIRLTNGRGFTPNDSWDHPRVAVVNRHLALRHFQNGEPVGRDLYLGTGWPRYPYRVVGVVDDRPARGLGGAQQPYEVVYLSVLQFPPSRVDLLVRRPGPALTPGTIGGTDLIEIARQSLGGQTIAGPVQPEAEYLASQARPIAWFGAWFAAAGLVVLLAGIAGTFGTVAMWVRSVTHEIAVRRALGATRGRMLVSVLSRAAGIGIGGTGVGLFLFFVVFREALRAQLVGLPAWQSPVFLRTAVGLVVVALLAALLPAWRLVRKPPATLLG